MHLKSVLAASAALAAALSLGACATPSGDSSQSAAAAPERAPAAPVRAAKADTGPAAVAGDPNRMVCKSYTPSGSRLGAQKVCRTAQQWADMQREQRQAVERTQNQQGSDTTTLGN